MNTFVKTFSTVVLLLVSASGNAQSDSVDDAEELKITALEALMSAPPERALPIVEKVLNGSGSDEMKSRALFILSQIDTPEAQATLVDAARNTSGELRLEAIRMIGISGKPEAMSVLSDLYTSGDGDVKDAVLEAYLIADDSEAVYQIALDTEDPDEFENAVEMLGAMGATDQLRALRERSGMSDALIDAYAIAGDVESLQALANDSSDPERQVQAIEALGVAGGSDIGPTLAEIYRSSESPDIREAALDGMMIAGNDEVVLELFRASQDAEEKRNLLEMLVHMDSAAVWDIIDQTLEN